MTMTKNLTILKLLTEDHVYLIMELFIKDNGPEQDFVKEEACKFGRTEVSMLDIGKMIKLTEKVD